MCANISTLSYTPTAHTDISGPQAVLRYPLFCKLLPYHLAGLFCLCAPHIETENKDFLGLGLMEKSQKKKDDLRPFLSRARRLLPARKPEAVYLEPGPCLTLLSPARAGNTPWPPLLAGCVAWSLPYQKRLMFWKGHTFSQIQSLKRQCCTWDLLLLHILSSPLWG